nr:prepilin-type N-terminal cleavage/methylation domain-containing protein [uncultured Campylobacter sp.]
MKKAFTLLELMVVIVIIGLLSHMGIQMTLNIYRSYLQSRAINTLETQTELVLEQISKRLAIRVRGSTIGKQPAANGNGAFVSTSAAGLNNTFSILEWVTYSYESFQDGGWSGFADLGSPNTAIAAIAGNVRSGTVSTPGSRLAVSAAAPNFSADQNIRDLTSNAASIANGNIGIVFKNMSLNSATSFGYNRTNANSIGTIVANGQNNILSIANYRDALISEQYYLLHTAYAVVPGQASANGDFSLFLHYNFRPWAGQEYNNGNSDLLATNVTRFNFTEANGVMALKLCIRDAGRSLSQAEAETTVCKTKAIY